ncbi:Striatin-interacting protein 2 [Tyrophagus putrescentiae]|nr:Striatin-interacting protein 2 [Tyrophagus putrescentiae]
MFPAANLIQLVHFEVEQALKLSDGPPPPAPIPTSSQSGSITSAEVQSTHGRGGRCEEATQLKQTFLINNKSLPWIPKVRQKEIDVFLAQVRKKFIGYALPDGEFRETTAGLPAPIHESVDILKKHLYESLGGVQVRREEDIARYPLTVGELDEEAAGSFAETLYRAMLPSLPQYLISLLKLLLASVSSVKSKTDGGPGGGLAGVAMASAAAANVITEVGGSIQPPPSSEVAATVLHSLRLKIDLNRHQEIIIKSISAILLLLLKHYKLNHVYQFEYISQQLMFANCIPLVIKFVSQEMADFVTARNTIPGLDFPNCVIGAGGSGGGSGGSADQLAATASVEISAETIDGILGETSVDSTAVQQQPSPYYCWRNLFSSINLLRILNKLTKWKNCRIMMLVLFKSAQPLKRSLRVRQAMFQVYALKLLKMQAKFRGRQWRKNNMKTMSAIYQKVRHRLNDDWAFANDVDSKQLYFQTEEFLLQAAINRFHHRRYEKPFPAANMVNSVTAQALSASASSGSFKINDGISGGGSYPGTPSTPLSTAAAAAAASMFGFDGGNAGASAHLAPGVGPVLAALYEADLFTPVDTNLQSVLGRPLQLTREFKRNYEQWLEREVFACQIDWDDLMGTDRRLTSPDTAIQLLEEGATEDMDCSSSVLSFSATSTILRRGSGGVLHRPAVPSSSQSIVIYGAPLGSDQAANGNNNNNSNPNSAPPSSGNIDFTYCDTDLHLKELAELYSYNEELSITQMPVVMITLRSVEEEERSLALGMQFVLFRLFGYIPSPIVFGNVIDSTCLVWKAHCGLQGGFCLLYNIEQFRIRYVGICSMLKVTATLLFFLDWLLITYREKRELKRAATLPVTFTPEEIVSSIISLDRLSFFGGALGGAAGAWGPETIAETDEETNAAGQSVASRSAAAGINCSTGGPGDSDYNSAIEEEEEEEEEEEDSSSDLPVITDATPLNSTATETFPLEAIGGTNSPVVVTRQPPARHRRHHSQSHCNA